MAVSSGPDIVDSGLVLALDAADRNSFDSNENFLLYSEQFDNASWDKINASVTPNATVAPDGTLTADTITATVNDDVIISQSYTASYNSTPLTYSIFAKAGTYRYIAIQSFVNVWSKTLVFDLQTGTALTPFYPNDGRTWNIVAYPNGWYRCIVTYPANYYYYYYFQFGLTNYVGPADGGVSSATSPAVGEYIYVWGAQIERGSSASPYYPTTGTAKNRGSTLIDLTGRANTGTLTNGPTYSSANGGSIVFDGTNDYIDCGLSSFQPTAISLCAWVKHTVNGDGGIIVKGDVNESTEWGLSFGYSNPWLLVGRATTYNNELVHPWTGSLLTGFHYVCYTMVNNTRASLYVDGVQVATTNTIGSIGLNAKNVLIGKWNNYAPLNGSVAQVKIYNRELSATEIQQNFNSVRSRFGI